ncbi:MAG: pantetheine-phosphate adenylyltransferase [Muribaculaceae bacterium]|nr:pantetheine-phosphate adenylyltransferase [Muribaculaceae bacterium]
MKAFYAGSFDPFTIGHLSIARRALEMFETLIIGIGFNPAKQREREVEERLRQIKAIFAETPGVTVFAYEGITAEVARENGAGVLVRGVRNALDFEKEKELADINLTVFGMPTVMIPAEPSLSFVSSSMVRELSHFGCDASAFLPHKDNPKGK